MATHADLRLPPRPPKHAPPALENYQPPHPLNDAAELGVQQAKRIGRELQSINATIASFRSIFKATAISVLVSSLIFNCCFVVGSYYAYQAYHVAAEAAAEFEKARQEFIRR